MQSGSRVTAARAVCHVWQISVINLSHTTTKLTSCDAAESIASFGRELGVGEGVDTGRRGRAGVVPNAGISWSASAPCPPPALSSAALAPPLPGVPGAKAPTGDCGADPARTNASVMWQGPADSAEHISYNLAVR